MVASDSIEDFIKQNLRDRHGNRDELAAEIEAQRRRSKPRPESILKEYNSVKQVKVNHDISAAILKQRRDDESCGSEFENGSHHSASTNNLRTKQLINDENRRIGGLVSVGTRSVSQVRLRARRDDRRLAKK